MKKEPISREQAWTWLYCKQCGVEEVKVPVDTKEAVCWRCVTLSVPPPTFASERPKSDKPKGWHFMAVFVAKDGTVYHKGVEQPDLKGTLKPTKVKKTPNKKPVSSFEKMQKQQAKQDKLAAKYKKKQDKKNGKKKTTRRKRARKSV